MGVDMDVDGGWLPSANVVIVTGKGGVGKTTVAGAIGLAAARAGRRTLLVEVEGRDSLSRALGVAAWDHAERHVERDLWATSIDPVEAVFEYLEMFHGMRHVRWVLERSHALDFVTTAAPGLRDLLLVGKVYEVETRGPGGQRRHYDTIVMDAPPTGRIAPFLAAPSAVTEIVRTGQVRRQARQITAMLTDPARTQVVMVCRPEELPVTEAMEGAAALHDAGIRVDPVVVNRCLPVGSDGHDPGLVVDLPDEQTRTLLADAGLDWAPARVADLRDVVARHGTAVALQDDVLDRLRRLGAPIIGVPRVAATGRAEVVEAVARALTGDNRDLAGLPTSS